MQILATVRLISASPARFQTSKLYSATDEEVDTVSDGGIEPYQFEPVASDSPEESEDDNPESPDDERLHNTNW